ncbi:MAG TPA: DUF6510 family protein [Anaeromyxobacteraceae bacterium]|nr:DUF6510 family protein [Anaeromyxobacteraceae bacterium]
MLCADCGRVSAVGGLLLYGGAMGSVLRCPGCEALLLCIASGPAGYFIELRGIVRVPPPGGSSETAFGRGARRHA